MSIQILLDRYHQWLRTQEFHAGMTERIGDIALSTGNMEQDLARLVAVNEWVLPEIVSQLSAAAERLERIEQLLANPTRTAGQELFRRGSYALSQDWILEAVTDLRRAVEEYPYHPGSWFNLGLASARLDEHGAAAEAFAKCARYGIRQSPVMAATAVLLAAALYRQIGKPDNSLAILQQHIEPLNRCAEIHLALAVHHSHTDHLQAAFELVPIMTADALASGLGEPVEQAAATICLLPEGPVKRLRAVEHAMTALEQIADAMALANFGSLHPPLALPPDGADALLLAEESIAKVADRGMERVRQAQLEMNRLASLVTAHAAQEHAFAHNIELQLAETRSEPQKFRDQHSELLSALPGALSYAMTENLEGVRGVMHMQAMTQSLRIFNNDSLLIFAESSAQPPRHQREVVSTWQRRDVGDRRIVCQIQAAEAEVLLRELEGKRQLLIASLKMATPSQESLISMIAAEHTFNWEMTIAQAYADDLVKSRNMLELTRKAMGRFGGNLPPAMLQAVEHMVQAMRNHIVRREVNCANAEVSAQDAAARLKPLIISAHRATEARLAAQRLAPEQQLAASASMAREADRGRAQLNSKVADLLAAIRTLQSRPSRIVPFGTGEYLKLT